MLQASYSLFSVEMLPNYGLSSQLFLWVGSRVGDFITSLVYCFIEAISGLKSGPKDSTVISDRMEVSYDCFSLVKSPVLL